MVSLDKKTFTHKKISIFYFAIPAPNAVCERVSGLSKVQWSDGRNKPDISTVGALLKVTVNFEMSCREMHQKLTNNEVALMKICFNGKYIKQIYSIVPQTCITKFGSYYLNYLFQY